MKKNRAMRIAALLLVLTMMTSCFVGGTFAKYVTAGTTNAQTAKVAKWDVVITPNGTLFSKTYATDDTSTYTGANSVETTETWNVIAPGTTKTMTDIVLAGAPEVAYKVTYTAELTLTNWLAKDGVAEYCPIIFTVEGDTYGIPAHLPTGTVLTHECTDITDLIAQVKAAINGTPIVCGPNESLSAVNVPNVSWSWPFENTTANNENDTALGKAVAAEISLKIDVNVEQVD